VIDLCAEAKHQDKFVVPISSHCHRNVNQGVQKQCSGRA